MLRTCAIDFLMKEKCSEYEIENTCTKYILLHSCALNCSESIWNPTDSLFHPSLVPQMSGLWTRMELWRCIRPSIRLWMFGILSSFLSCFKHTSGSRKTGIVCEVPRSNRKHRRTQLVLVVSCNLFLLHFPDGFITSTLFYNERNVFPHFHGSFLMEPSTFLF